MIKSVGALILESGASRGDLIFIRFGNGEPFPGARLTTAPDLLRLKAEALGLEEPLVATGPSIDETYADIVIDASRAEPTIIKHKGNGNPAPTLAAE